MKCFELERLKYIFCFRYLLWAICHVLFIALLWFKRVLYFQFTWKNVRALFWLPISYTVGEGKFALHQINTTYRTLYFLMYILCRCDMYVKISEKGVTDFQVYIIRWEAAWSRRALKKNLEGGLWISSLWKIVGDRLHRLFTWYHN